MNEIAEKAHHPGPNTGMPNRKLLMWVFIASECMVFGALIATYLIYEGKSLVGPFPADVFDIPLTTIITFILLMSSLSMALAVGAAQRRDLKTTRIWLAVTILMGLVFLGTMMYEYSMFIDAGLRLSTNLFGSTFYVLTGVHGVHIAIGLIWLLSVLGHTWRPVDPERRALDIELAGLYWHFVDIVWIVIFTVVYLLGVGG